MAAKKANNSDGNESDYPLRLEWRTPEELAENPSNWRTHPNEQLTALSDVIGQVGWAGAVLLNEKTGHLIDGHARKKLPEKLTVGGKIPVLIGSWDESQEKLILATLDPLSAMAEANAAALDSLLREVDTGSEAVAKMLEELAEGAGIIPSGENGESDRNGLDVGGLKFRVVVEVSDESAQATLIDRLEKEGYKCLPLMS